MALVTLVLLTLAIFVLVLVISVASLPNIVISDVETSLTSLRGALTVSALGKLFVSLSVTSFTLVFNSDERISEI